MAKFVSGDPARRLIISCPAPLRAALQDMADATGQPVATVATQVLVEMVPNLHDLAKYLRLMKAGKKDSAKRALQHAFGNAYAEMLHEQGELQLARKATKKGGAR